MPIINNNLLNIKQSDYYAYPNYAQLYMEKSYANTYIINPKSYEPLKKETFRNIQKSSRDELNNKWAKYLFMDKNNNLVYNINSDFICPNNMCQSQCIKPIKTTEPFKSMRSCKKKNSKQTCRASGACIIII